MKNEIAGLKKDVAASVKSETKAEIKRLGNNIQIILIESCLSTYDRAGDTNFRVKKLELTIANIKDMITDQSRVNIKTYGAVMSSKNDMGPMHDGLVSKERILKEIIMIPLSVDYRRHVF